MRNIFYNVILPIGSVILMLAGLVWFVVWDLKQDKIEEAESHHLCLEVKVPVGTKIKFENEKQAYTVRASNAAFCD